MGKHGSPEKQPSASESQKEGLYGPLYSAGDGDSLGYQKPAPREIKKPTDPLGYIKGRGK